VLSMTMLWRAICSCPYEWAGEQAIPYFGRVIGLQPKNARSVAAARAAGLMPWGLVRRCRLDR